MKQENILSWIFKKIFYDTIKIVPKKLDPEAECVITLVCIGKYSSYYQCDLCEQVYLKDELDKWFESKLNYKCPYCQTNSINTGIIYLNY